MPREHTRLAEHVGGVDLQDGAKADTKISLRETQTTESTVVPVAITVQGVVVTACAHARVYVRMDVSACVCASAHACVRV